MQDVSYNLFSHHFSRALIQAPRILPTAICWPLVMALSGCGGDGIGSESDDATDPVQSALPIAFIKRTLTPEDEGDPISFPTDLEAPAEFTPGAALYLRSNASLSATETNLTDTAFEPDENGERLYDVKDVEVSYDGNKLLFAMRAPEIEDADDEDQPTWNIWEYTLDTGELSRVIGSDILAEEGHDVEPYYLPNGDIVFSSTRQSRAKEILLSEGKLKFSNQTEGNSDDADAFNLHTMDSDGNNLTQITFNQSHDLDPSVLSDGRIVFTRWDNAGNRDRMSLYTLYPDGSQLSFLYGVHSHDTGTGGETIQFTQARELPNGQLLVSLSTTETDDGSIALVNIDTNQYSEQRQLIDGTEATSDAQSNATSLTFNTDGSLSSDGKIISAYPLNDGSDRYLINWSPCLLETITEMVDEEENEASTEEPVLLSACTADNLASIETDGAQLQESFPRYGVGLYNPNESTINPIVVGQADIIVQDVVSVESRSLPPYLTSTVSTDLADNQLGQIHIRSVYDFDGIDTAPNGLAAMADPSVTAAADRPYRFIRIVKAVSIPDEDILEIDNTAFGASQQQLMREIIGYVPIEPDGSALFTIPANIPIALSLLNEAGERVSERHQNWLHVAAGETLTCLGCHTGNSEVVHGRLDSQLTSINSGSDIDGSFANTNSDITATVGQTMAEAIGARTPTTDIRFTDEWAAPGNPLVGADLNYLYSDLDEPHPVTSACQTEWSALCRTVINYEDHIQPVWSKTRQTLNDDDEVIADNTCTICHNTVAPKANPDDPDVAQVPSAQLDLTGTPSLEEPAHLISYRELFFNDEEQALNEGGELIVREEIIVDGNGNTVFQTNEDGELILDANNDPIPVTQTFTVRPSMSANGAQASNAFFTPFNSVGSVNHTQLLSPSELKLIREWLDIGAQYINNPFLLVDD